MARNWGLGLLGGLAVLAGATIAQASEVFAVTYQAQGGARDTHVIAADSVKLRPDGIVQAVETLIYDEQTSVRIEVTRLAADCARRTLMAEQATAMSGAGGGPVDLGSYPLRVDPSVAHLAANTAAFNFICAVARDPRAARNLPQVRADSGVAAAMAARRTAAATVAPPPSTPVSRPTSVPSRPTSPTTAGYNPQDAVPPPFGPSAANEIRRLNASPMASRLWSWHARPPSKVYYGQDFFQAAGINPNDVLKQLAAVGVDPKTAVWARVRLYADYSHAIYVLGLCSNARPWCGNPDDSRDFESAVVINVTYGRDGRDYVDIKSMVSNFGPDGRSRAVKYCELEDGVWKCFNPDPVDTATRDAGVRRVTNRHAIRNLYIWVSLYLDHARKPGQLARARQTNQALGAALGAAVTTNRPQDPICYVKPSTIAGATELDCN